MFFVCFCRFAVNFRSKNKIREASVIFCFKQLITWLLGLFVAEFNLIEYPVRLFANATKASFTFEYFVYPSICVIFNLYYPERKSLFKRILYYFIYTAAITVFEVILEKYTQNIKYINWTWYYTFLSVYLTFFLSRAYFKWFFKISNNAPC
ncbi:CBO0543 family protein [Acetivibrio thermocellus]|uniref:CBO0543 family protein n=1 Tax=Acetivibrio thermocellus TaxID=1515 RepID=UPI002E2742D5